MHESSLVQALFAQVATVLSQHPTASVEMIHVEIGPLSGVEPLLIEAAFERLVAESPCRGASLHIEQVDLSARCRHCEREFVIQRFLFVCPVCRSTAVTILGGDEFRLLDITISEPETRRQSGDCELAYSQQSRQGDQ